jgi:hypothetical protein
VEADFGGCCVGSYRRGVAGVLIVLAKKRRLLM